MASSRDNFTKEVARALQERAGNHCSNPRCRCLTSGPNESPTKSSRVGIAAHITAAAPGGPRYDHSITAEERSSIKNGIWLCQSCSRPIDSDPNHYKVPLLLQWRTAAEQWAREHIESGTRFSVPDSSTKPAPSRSNEARELPYIEYSIDEKSIKHLSKKEIHRHALIFYTSFLPSIFILLANERDIISLSDTRTAIALIIAVLTAVISTALTKTQRKVEATIFRPNTATFIDGHWFEQKPDGNYIQYIKTAQCIHPKCSGTIFIRFAPPREQANHTLIGVCNIGGQQHTYTVDFNGIGYPQQFDWRAPEKQAP